MNAKNAISQHSLHDELLDRLKRMIISGYFVPGDKVPERQLCEQFGVSRTPLREALKVLAAEGLVNLAPNRGAVIANLSEEELEESLPISAAVEMLMGELACENITEAEIEEIRALHQNVVSSYAAGDMKSFVSLSQKIHEKIVIASQNPLLASIYDTLFFQIGWTRLMTHLSGDAYAKLFDDHEQILAALESRDGERLSAVLKNYFEHVLGTSYKSERSN